MTKWPLESTEERVRRPVKLVTAFAQRYPGVWKHVDRLRANRDEISKRFEWPPWCYLPWGGAKGIIALGGARDFGFLNMEGAFLATLGSWRITKDIYIFDETVFKELWKTPIEGKLPIDVLHRLPAWCVYVAFPEPRLLRSSDHPGQEAYGFFAHMNHSGEGPALMMALDFGSVDRINADRIGLAPYTLELREGSDLLQCLTAMDAKIRAKHPAGYQFSERFVESLGSREECERVLLPQSVREVLEPLLSLAVYLCSTSAEIRAQDPLRGLRKSITKKTRRGGVRTFVSDAPQVWEVAFRIGATLRAAASAIGHGGDGGGTHASPRPHIRRAHWHSFWTGPKATVGKPEVPPRELIVKWIPPIAVAVGPDGEIIPTVHRVM
jgi:hypothetical protein